MSQATPDKTADWQDLAARLDSLSEDMMAASEALSDDLDNQIVQLQAVTLRHYAHHIREYSYRTGSAARAGDA